MPSLLAIGAAALVCCAGPAAANNWYLSETYDAANFFDKFDFFTSDYSTGDFNDVDPTSGYVNYLSYADASASGLAAIKGSDVYLGVDSVNKLVEGTGEKGRDAVRVESKDIFTHGLFIARFSHIPKPTCGSWPAFWSYGADWPTQGEIDLIEQWNVASANHPALHTGLSKDVGSCVVSGGLESLASIITPDCDNSNPNQKANEGCTFTDTTAPWGRDDGGVYAMEWSSDAVKLYAWTWDNVPGNLDSDSIDTSSWGAPSVIVPNSQCDVDRHFSNHRLVLNLNFCGILAGDSAAWDLECGAKTGAATCGEYVAQNPAVFSDVFFQIQDIRVFGTEPPVATPSSTTAASPTSDSNSVPVSSSHSASSSPSLIHPTSSPSPSRTGSLITSATRTTTVRSTETTTNPTPSPDIIVLLPDRSKAGSTATHTFSNSTATMSYPSQSSSADHPILTRIRTHTKSSPTTLGTATPSPAIETLRTASGSPIPKPTGANGNDDADNNGSDDSDEDSMVPFLPSGESHSTNPASSLSLPHPTASPQPATGSSSDVQNTVSGGNLGAQTGVVLFAVVAAVFVSGLVDLLMVG